MKTLHLIRHAKSSWDYVHLADIERPLNMRGRKSCKIMAHPIENAGCQFEHVFCSPAIRAQSTIEGINREILHTDIEWETDDQLYTFDAENLFHWCQAVNEVYSNIVIVGHNPALTELTNYLSDSQIENLPTCGYIQLVTKQSIKWQSIAKGSFILAHFLTPKTVSHQQ